MKKDNIGIIICGWVATVHIAAVIREVKPHVVLTHSPADDMEDHTNTSRLIVTAAFARAMPNFRSVPSRPAADCDTTQGWNSMTTQVQAMAGAVGRASKKLKFAEGWRRHLHYGFSATDVDPLREALGGNYLVNKVSERGSGKPLRG
ncbi:MAG: hypothetical protein MUF81_04995 [Verrucomicrobia bacterium]|jgi:LmbE family N-acetylglucosaminyl deacetylase|nr:hypothetical protein [Verrucomicrobiota bacterium]